MGCKETDWHVNIVKEEKGMNQNLSAPPLPPRNRFSPILSPPQPAVRQSKLSNDLKPFERKLKKAVSESGGDSGLQSDASSIRSSSLVSSCSSGIDELLAQDQKLK